MSWCWPFLVNSLYPLSFQYTDSGLLFQQRHSWIITLKYVLFICLILFSSEAIPNMYIWIRNAYRFHFFPPKSPLPPFHPSFIFPSLLPSVLPPFFLLSLFPLFVSISMSFPFFLYSLPPHTLSILSHGAFDFVKMLFPLYFFFEFH